MKTGGREALRPAPLRESGVGKNKEPKSASPERRAGFGESVVDAESRVSEERKSGAVSLRGVSGIGGREGRSLRLRAADVRCRVRRGFAGWKSEGAGEKEVESIPTPEERSDV